MLNFELVFKKYLKFLVSLVLVLSYVLNASAKEAEIDLSEVKTWSEFKSQIEEKEKRDQMTGQAYMISGGLLVLGGLIGYHNSRNSVEKLAYSVSQSLGVAGIGYGAYLSFVDSEERSFYETIDKSNSLSATNRDEIVRNYVVNWEENRRAERTTRIVTHSIVGVLNVYNGLREEQSDLKQGLVIIGGINLLAALSLTLEF